MQNLYYTQPSTQQHNKQTQPMSTVQTAVRRL